MKRTMARLGVVFFMTVAIAAGGTALTSAPTAAVASQGQSWCDENFPGVDYCHDDYKRNNCGDWGCNTAIEICCLP